jgi:hypothetical protein
VPGVLKIIVERFAYSLARTTDENHQSPNVEMLKIRPRGEGTLHERLSCLQVRNLEYQK